MKLLFSLKHTEDELVLGDTMKESYISDEEMEEKRFCFFFSLFLLPPLLLTIKQFKINTQY